MSDDSTSSSQVEMGVITLRRGTLGLHLGFITAWIGFIAVAIGVPPKILTRSSPQSLQHRNEFVLTPMLAQ